jgi:hypothetical protein
MLTLPVTVFFAIGATAPVNTPITNDILFLSAANSSLSTRANVDLVTHGDPSSPLCNTKVGRPGGVYVCPGPNFTPSATEQCKWHAPPAPGLSVCITFAEPLPQSIGPDPGGYCILFMEKGCKNAQAVVQVGGKSYKYVDYRKLLKIALTLIVRLDVRV